MKSLVVDDEFLGRAMLARFLGAYGSCDEAGCGMVALEMLEKAMEDGVPYDFVCLDVCMADMNGPETLAALRMLEESRALPPSKVMMISAGKFPDGADAAFAAAGSVLFLEKPFSRKSLHEVLCAAHLVD